MLREVARTFLIVFKLLKKGNACSPRSVPLKRKVVT